jgi:hypothetical protein
VLYIRTQCFADNSVSVFRWNLLSLSLRFYLRLRMKPTHVGPTDRASLFLLDSVSVFRCNLLSWAPGFCLRLQVQPTQSPSSGATYSVGPNIQSYFLSPCSCLRLQIKLIQLGPRDGAPLCLRKVGTSWNVDIIQSPKRCVVNKEKTMYDVQHCDSYIMYLRQNLYNIQFQI